ncbi:hypothetical protein L218DRAFT_993656 [Marasmius fiardii PR-910]|nr:hypothetical protein L218DRAFT_993656 [Marasmius fiardii PR-910]
MPCYAVNIRLTNNFASSFPHSTTIPTFLERPMKIEIVVDPARPAPLSARVAPAIVAATTQTNAPRGTARPGRGRKTARGGKRKSPRPQKTAADLDAEMEDYTAGTGNTAAPAATAS